jgi:hypothetical protein
MNVLDPVENFAEVTVSAGYDDAAVSITLQSGEGAKLPDPSTRGAFNVSWFNSTDYPNPSGDPNREIVRVTARSGDTLTVVRAQEGTSASVKNAAGKTYRMVLAPTRKFRDDIETAVGIDGLAAKAAPVDGDEFSLFDSAASTLRKLTYANLKATLKGYFDTLYNLYAHPNHTGDVTSVGDGAQTIANDAVTNAKLANVATQTLKGRATAGTGDPEDLTAAQARSILNVADGATANDTNAQLRDRSTHTGTQAIGTVTGLQTALDGKLATSHEGTGGLVHANAVAGGAAGFMTGTDKSKLDGIANGANNYTHPNHSGDITSVGDGATTIVNDAVTNLKLANMATQTIKGRTTAGTGDPEDLAPAAVRTMLNVSDGADVTSATTVGSAINGSSAKATPVDADAVALIDSAASNALKKTTWANVKATLKAYFDTLYNLYVHPNHTGDVTSAGDGATTIAAGAVTTSKMANVATGTVFYRKTAGTGAPEVQTLATLKTDLGLTGTNSGDQTITLTGDVTGSGTGSFAATIANNAVTVGKMQQVATGTVLGRTTAGTGNVEVLTTIPSAAMPAHTGDVTSSAGSTALSIANNAVTNAKLAQVATATIKGRTTAGTGNIEDLTVAQATAMLNAMVGDTGAGGVKGLVPAPVAGDAAAGKFLKADGTWASPSGGSVPQILVGSSFSGGETLGSTTRWENMGSAGSWNSGTNTGGSYIRTGATSGSYKQACFSIGSNQFARNSYFTTVFWRESGYSGSTGEAYFGTGTVTCSASGHAFTEKHYGFKVVRSSSVDTLYATNANGTTETMTDITSGTTTTDIYNEYCAQKNGTTNVKFYVNGVLKATHTSNLPSSGDGRALQCSVTTNNTSSDMAFNWRTIFYNKDAY